jgi:hypothetical protein
LAAEGADVIAVDICRQIDSVAYPMSGPEDLAETVGLVEEEDRFAAEHPDLTEAFKISRR